MRPCGSLPEQINTGVSPLDQASWLLLNQRLRLSIPLGTLPFGHQLTGVRSTADSIELDAQGVGIILRPWSGAGEPPYGNGHRSGVCPSPPPGYSAELEITNALGQVGVGAELVAVGFQPEEDADEQQRRAGGPGLW